MERSLVEFLASQLGRGIVSITGSGGKTSLMRALALHLKGRGFSVLVSTTTKLLSPELCDYGVDRIFVGQTPPSSPKAPGTADFLALPFSGRKVRAPEATLLTGLAAFYDYTLVEADGAAGLPLKLHRPHEPVVLPATASTIAVAGLRDWGKKATNGNFFALAPRYEGRTIDERLIADLIQDREGLLKGARGTTVLLLNQSEGAALDCSIIRGYFRNVWKASVRDDRIEL